MRVPVVKHSNPDAGVQGIFDSETMEIELFPESPYKFDPIYELLTLRYEFNASNPKKIKVIDISII